MDTLITGLGIVVGAAVATFGYVYSQRGARRAALALSFAEAIASVNRYRTLPYAIRRRVASDEQALVSLAHRSTTVHEALDYHLALMMLEAPAVGTEFANLVATARQEIAAYAKAAWEHPPVAVATDMNMGLGAAYSTPRTDAAAAKCHEAMVAALRSWRLGQ